MISMNNARALYDRYKAAIKNYGEACAAAPEQWHRPDVAEFKELVGLFASIR